jgi:hypothetical protein
MSKEQTFKMRLSDDDRERFDALAEHYASPVATVLRILVKREADALGIGPAKKSAKPSKRAAKRPAKRGAA